MQVRFSTVDAARTTSSKYAESHSLVALTAFNTDGFDFTGIGIWIHDVEVEPIETNRCFVTMTVRLSPFRYGTKMTA